MSDPIKSAKPVGPPPPGGRQVPPPPSGATAGQPPPQQQQPPPQQPPLRVYSWSSTGRSFPWLAILLLVLGVGLLVELLIPDLSLRSLIILAAGLAFGAAWLLGKFIGATVPALVLTAWGLAGIASDLEVITGDGWGTLFIGVAFLIGWGLGRFQDARREWALFIGAILTVIGLADASDALPFEVDIVAAIAVAMIIVGIYLVVRTRLPRWQAAAD